jgi:hypothetical protein
MKKQNLSMEIVHEIWDDDTGTHIEIGEDRDGLQMVEIRQYEGKLEPYNRMMFTVGEAQMVSSALFRLVNDMKSKYPECEASVV